MINADDEFVNAHDSKRLYVAVSIVTSESLQFMLPMETNARDEKAFWDCIVAHLFGTSYKDILESV